MAGASAPILLSRVPHPNVVLFDDRVGKLTLVLPVSLGERIATGPISLRSCLEGVHRASDAWLPNIRGRPQSVRRSRVPRELVPSVHPQHSVQRVPDLQVSFDAQALRLGSGAQLGFQFRMHADAHAWPSPLERDCNPPICDGHCVRAVLTLQSRARARQLHGFH